MQQHLKERLTGAAILVLVVVLLVPEMFRGRPALAVDSHPSSVDGAPIRTYTIDLRDSPTTQPPTVVPPAGAVTEIAPPEAPAARPPEASAASQAPTPATVATATPPAPSAPAPAAHPHAAAATSSWTVQVASFTRRDFADRMVKQVRAKGFAVRAVGPDDRGLYRVRSAPMSDHAAALALKEKMQSRGLKPIVTALP